MNICSCFPFSCVLFRFQGPSLYVSQNSLHKTTKKMSIVTKMMKNCTVFLFLSCVLGFAMCVTVTQRQQEGGDGVAFPPLFTTSLDNTGNYFAFHR